MSSKSFLATCSKETNSKPNQRSCKSMKPSLFLSIKLKRIFNFSDLLFLEKFSMAIMSFSKSMKSSSSFLKLLRRHSNNFWSYCSFKTDLKSSFVTYPLLLISSFQKLRNIFFNFYLLNPFS